MTDQKKGPVQYVREIESVRLANCMIRMLVGAIALVIRLMASIVLRIVRAISRRRRDW
jgi:hypothetical protein